jgi:hypothetical protein
MPTWGAARPNAGFGVHGIKHRRNQTQHGFIEAATGLAFFTNTGSPYFTIGNRAGMFLGMECSIVTIVSISDELDNI